MNLKEIWAKIKKAWFIFLLIREKSRVITNLELDIAFLEVSNDKIFELSEDALREKLDQANKRNDQKAVAEYERMINKYDRVKAIFGQSKDELKLATQYVEFLRVILKTTLWGILRKRS